MKKEYGIIGNPLGQSASPAFFNKKFADENINAEYIPFELKSIEELPQVLPLIRNFSHVRVRGLMAIPPISQNSGDNLKYFQKILQLSVDITGKKYDNVLVKCISMGMSDDFEDAIASGSTMIRVGTAIFGKRNYS